MSFYSEASSELIDNDVPTNNDQDLNSALKTFLCVIR